MHIVDELFPGKPLRTRVWVTKKARKEIENCKYPKRECMLNLIEDMAQNGFGNFIGDHDSIRRKDNGVYAIQRDGDLFRVIGFFENNTHTNFIAIDCFMKTGQKLGKKQRDCIAKVKKVCFGNKTWEYKN